MTPAETGRVLAKASAFDLRTVGEADVLAWHEVLADVDFADALEAVARHYADRVERIMPAHVRQLARAARNARKDREGRDDRLAIEADPARRDRSADVAALVAALRDALPDGDARKLRRAEVLEWERQCDRERWAEPNPHYTGPPPPGGFPLPVAAEADEQPAAAEASVP